jgi:hypothetical protein
MLFGLSAILKKQEVFQKYDYFANIKRDRI